MYTIIMTEDKHLHETIDVHPIYKNENKSTVIRFLIPEIINDINLSDCTAAIIYISPNNERSCRLITREPELYKGRFDYRFEITTDISAISGVYTFRLKFLLPSDTPEDEINISTAPYTFEVVDNYGKSTSHTPDALSQRIELLENELEKVRAESNGKGDDIEIIDGEIWLTSNGRKIGDPIPGSSHSITVFKREDMANG